MCKHIKEKFPQKNIWIYTGYSIKEENGQFFFENDKKESFLLPWLDKIDVIVDGKFELSTRQEDISNKRRVLWRGSSNQRIIDVKESLDKKKVVVISDDSFC